MRIVNVNTNLEIFSVINHSFNLFHYDKISSNYISTRI